LLRGGFFIDKPCVIKRLNIALDNTAEGAEGRGGVGSCSFLWIV